ncbi:MAG: hypothetical protein KBT28_11195 [Bacteroidales bacterium]|nr:hypothetical protein [Candidatus Colimorpha merdihippi]
MPKHNAIQQYDPLIARHRGLFVKNGFCFHFHTLAGLSFRLKPSHQ